MPLYTTPTISESRRARRRQLGDEFQAGMATGLGGIDKLNAARRQAGLDAEASADKTEERAAKREDALARAKAEAEKLALDREQGTERMAIERERMTADGARASRRDDLEAKRVQIAEDEARRRRDTDGEKMRREEEDRGEKEKRAQARRMLQAVDGMDAEAGAGVLDEIRAMGLDDAEITSIREEMDRAKTDRSLDLAERREKIAALKRRGTSSGDASAGKTPTTQEAMAIGEIDGLLSNLNEIASKKPGINTGPIAGRVGVLRSMVGVGDPAVTAFRAEVGSQLADYIQSISGAAASDVERAFLKQNVPDVNDSDGEFNAKLERVQSWAARKRRTLLGALQAAKRDVSGFGTESAGAQMSDEQIADAVMDEMPDATEEQIADEIERRKRGGR